MKFTDAFSCDATLPKESYKIDPQKTPAGLFAIKNNSLDAVNGQRRIDKLKTVSGKY